MYSVPMRKLKKIPEGTRNIQGHIANDLYDQMERIRIEGGYLQGRTLNRLVHFWTLLPSDMQRRLYAGLLDTGNPEDKLMVDLMHEVDLSKVKADLRMTVNLNCRQIQNLLISARQRSDCWRVRLLLAITTGLRKEDIEKIQIGDIDFENHSVRTRSKKTRKAMPDRPLHSALVPILSRYVA